MKVILLNDVKNVGKKNDLVTVSDGYAMNFLINKGLAIPGTHDNIGRLAHQNKLAQEELLEKNLELLEEKRQIEEITLNFKLQVNKGKAIGSVSLIQIEERLKKEFKITVDKRKFSIHEPLKDLGLHYITIKLSHEIEAKLKVNVEGNV